MFTVPKTERKLPPAGTHVARLYQIIDLGTQAGGRFEPKRQVRFAWELCNELTKFGDDDKERPYSISKTYGLSLHEKATLRKHLEAWRGKPFTDEETRGFDEQKLLGLPCLVTIVHEDKGERTYANVASISGIPKGTVVPEQVNASVSYHVMSGDTVVYRSLPQFLQETIAKSPEFQGVVAKGNSADDDQPPELREEPDDDSIPF